jgi:hypothetical protein
MRTFPSRRGLVIGATAAGLALFALALRSADPASVLDGVRRVGAGFVWISLIAGLRLVVRAAAWCVCAGGRSRLTFRSAFGACLAGEAAGSLTPLGLAASEPVKVVWVRERLGTVEAAASLAVETLLYSISVAAMLAAGTVVWVTRWLPIPIGLATAGAVAAVAVAAAFAWWARHGRSPGLSIILGWLYAAGRHSSLRRPVADAVKRTGEILGTLVFRSPWLLASASLLELSFQALSVLEVWATLALLGVDAGLIGAFLLDYVNRAVTVAFKFIPLRLGVDEWASAAMASLLGTGGAVGVTVAVIRKARVLCWSLAGLVIGASRAMSSGDAPRTIQVPAEPADGSAL